VTIKTTAQLSKLETLYAAIRNFEPTNEIEHDARRVLLDLLRARRTKLRKEAVKIWIRRNGRAA